MKKLRLLIVGILGVMLWGSYSFGANMYIAPSDGELGKGCVEAFSVRLAMEEGEEAIAMDLRLDSNMEFVGFKNGEVFEYTLPPKVNESNGYEYITLLNNSNITKGGLLGTLYYRVNVDEDPYLNFYFNGIGDTTDTSLYLDGKDILTSVRGGKYVLSYEKSCDNELENMTFETESIDEFVERFENDQHITSDNGSTDNKCMFIIISLLVVIIVIILLLLIRKKKISKSAKMCFLMLIFGSIIFSGLTLGDYLYFSGNGNNDNGFQQGCPEKKYIYYSIANNSPNYNASSFSVTMDDSFSYKTGVSLFFNITNNKFSWASSDKPIIWDGKNVHGTFGIDAGFSKGQKDIGYINFTPKYNENPYTGYLVYKYIDDFYYANANTVGLIYDNHNYITGQTQISYLTGAIPVEQSPCVDDGQPPRIINVNYANGSSHIDKKKLEFDIKDDDTNQVGTGAVPYIWKKIGQNLVWTSNNNQNINNQIGVLDTTVTVKVTGTGLDGTVYTNRDANVTCNGKGILAWTGGWERDYGCEVTAADLLPQEFGVEEPITITISGKDRLNHQTGTSITFNSPVQPDIKDWTLTNGVYPNKNDNSNRYGIDSQIRFTVKDDWAGVDSGSIVVKITGTGGYSKTYTGTVDTGNISLTISNGSEGKGYAAWYDVVVTLTPDEYLPVDDKITVNVSFKDLVNQTRSRSWYFYTRKSCVDLGCCDGTEIYTGLENSHISFTGEELFISGGNNIEVTTGNITYFGNIFTGGVLINCNYVGLTLFKGTPENNNSVSLGVFTDEIIFTGNDTIYGVLSGNVLTFYKVPLGSVEFSNLRPNEGAPKSNFDFEWDASIGEGTNFSGFRVELYSGDSCEGSPIWSGYASGTGARSLTYDSDDLVSLQHYCWKVSAMARNTVISSGTATFTGMVEMIVKVNLGRANLNNESTGKLLIYSQDNHNLPIYSGYVHILGGGTGVHSANIDSGCYDVVYKSWQSLSSYLTGVCLDAELGYLDFTQGSGVDNGNLKVGDLPSKDSNGNWTHDFFVNGADLSLIYGKYCLSGAIKVEAGFNDVCDVNKDGVVNSSDGTPILNYLDVADVAFKETDDGLFRGFGFVDYNLSD